MSALFVNLHTNTMGKGYPLIIVHGVFGMADNWITIAKELSKTYSVHLTDLRNHGRSPHSDIFTYEAMAADLAHLCNGFTQRPVIIGHSMGGKAAMFASALYPETFKAICVVDIGPKYYPIHHQTIIETLLSVDLPNCQSRNEVEATLAKGIPEPDVRLFLMKNLYRNENGQFAWRLNLPVIARDIAKVGIELPKQFKINLPSLFIKGENSRYILPEDWQGIQEQFPNADLEIVRGAGHWVHADNPKETNEIISQFLSSLTLES